MAKTLAEEIALLKKDNRNLKKRVSLLEKRLEINPSVSTTSAESSVTIQQATSTATETSPSSTGIVLPILFIVLGVMSFELFHIYSAGLIILGIVLLISRARNSDSSLNSDLSESKEDSENQVVDDSAHEVKESEPLAASYTLDVSKVFGLIGILALVIGFGFFIRFAIDRNWISYLGRILGGIFLGLALVISGLMLSKRKDISTWAQIVSGGGFSILYFTVYALYGFPAYREAIGVPLIIVLLLLTLVIVFAGIVSYFTDSKIIISLTFVLGYITSLLTIGFTFVTLVYILFLSIALILVSYYKKWQVLDFANIFLTYLIYLLWNGDNIPSFMTASVFLISYYMVFTVLALLSKRNISQSAFFILINNVFFFSAFMGLLGPGSEVIVKIWVLPLILSILNVVLFFVESEKSIKDIYLYLSVFFMVYALLHIINLSYLSILYIVLGVLLLSVGLHFKLASLAYSGYAVSFLGGLKTFFYDTFFLQSFSLENIMGSTRLLSYVVAIIVFFSLALFLKYKKELDDFQRIYIPALYSGFATLLTIVIAFLEFSSFYAILTIGILNVGLCVFSKGEQLRLLYQTLIVSIVLGLSVITYPLWGNSQTLLLAYLVVVGVYYLIHILLETKGVNNSDIFSWAGTFLLVILLFIELRDFWVSIGLSIVGISALALGFSFKKNYFRQQGISILSIVILKTFLYDTRYLDTVYRTLSFIVLGVLLLGVSFVYAKYKDSIKEFF